MAIFDFTSFLRWLFGTVHVFTANFVKILHILQNIFPTLQVTNLITRMQTSLITDISYGLPAILLWVQ